MDDELQVDSTSDFGSLDPLDPSMEPSEDDLLLVERAGAPAPA